MSNDERPQDDSASDPYDEAATTETRVQSHEPVASDDPAPTGRWERVSEPARRHPIGLAVGTALAGLVIGLLGGVALNAHPMLSLQVGTAPGLTSVDRLNPVGPPQGPAGDRHGPGAERGPGGPDGGRGPGGDRGPGAERGPRGPGGDGRGPDDAPPPPSQGGAGPSAPGGAGPARPANPGADAPPLPAERGAAGQSSGT